MSQSEAHKNLLFSLTKWIQDYCDHLEGLYSISADHMADNNFSKPPKIINSVPDVFAKSLSSSHFIIGEAETSLGLLHKDTDRQLENFLSYCSHFKESLFVLAVPWDMVIRAKSILKQIKIEINAQDVLTIVIEKLET
jgi:hypothetical protein